MAIRLPNVYYTEQIVDGVPEPPGKPVPIIEYQGTDIIFKVLLYYEGEPVTEDKWKISGKLKSSNYTLVTDLVLEPDVNIFKLDFPGYYKILIPSETTAELLAGTYWLDIMITEKVGTDYKLIDKILVTQPFSLEYGISSPNPDHHKDRRKADKSVPSSLKINRF